jgi:hypothetical protein
MALGTRTVGCNSTSQEVPGERRKRRNENEFVFKEFPSPGMTINTSLDPSETIFPEVLVSKE